MPARKVIISCAVTGAIHTPSMSPHLPVTPEQIADAAVGAADAGAAIVHLHARNPVTGEPDQTPEAFARFLPDIKQRSNCVINLTTGGAPTMSIEERVQPAARFAPELASLNLGSMNFGLFGMLERFSDLEMLSQARAISFEATPSPLEAALLEPDEIKRHRPHYNVALTSEKMCGHVQRRLHAPAHDAS